MGFIEDTKKILHYKKIAAYVKKNKKDDMRTGIYYLAGASVISALTGIIGLILNYAFSGFMYPEGSEAFASTLAAIGWNTPVNAALVMIISWIVGFIGCIMGVAITHYIAAALGGKAKMGEYFYIGGKFIFIVAIVNFILNIFSAVPCINCITGILALAFMIYSIYLIILLVSVLYSISMLKAFAGIVVSYLVSLIFILLVLTVLGEITGLPLGLKMYEQMFENYGAMDLGAYSSFNQTTQ